jgi:hypothetical protein
MKVNSLLALGCYAAIGAAADDDTTDPAASSSADAALPVFKVRSLPPPLSLP